MGQLGDYISSNDYIILPLANGSTWQQITRLKILKRKLHLMIKWKAAKFAASDWKSI